MSDDAHAAAQRDSKRPRRAAAAAAKGTTAAAAAPAPAAPPAPAPRRRQQQPPPQSQQHHHESWLDRTAAALDLIIERQRQAAQKARVERRREFRSAIRRPGGGAPGDLAWTVGSEEDEDDGDVELWGGRATWWREARNMVPRAASSPDAQEEEEAASGLEQAPPAGLSAPERDFLETCASAASACREWRAVVLRHSKCLTLRCRGVEWDDWESLLRGLARADGGGGRGSAERALDALSSCRPGVLRGLRLITGAGKDDPGLPPRQLASPLDVARLAKRCADNPTTLMRVIRFLKTARVDGAWAFTDAMAALSRCCVLSIPEAPPRARAFFASLKRLEIGRFLSRWAPLPPPSRSYPPCNGFRPDRAPERDERPLQLFSKANFPSLTYLAVTLHKNSNVPLELPWGNERASAALRPPPLERLLVAGVCGDGPAGPTRNAEFSPVEWPRCEPFLVARRSLAALAPTLRWFWSDMVLAVPVGHHGDEISGPDAPPLPVIEEGDGEYMEFHRDIDGEYESARSTGNPERNPPGHIAPMERLEALGRLTRLEALRLDVELDWWPVVVPIKRDWSEVYRDRLIAKRRLAWNAGARAWMAPLANTLRRLEVYQVGFGRIVALPPALSLLVSLEHLTVRCHELSNVGPVGKLTNLRSLAIETDNVVGLCHPPIFPKDLAPLARLEHLRLSHCPTCIAPIIRDQLPALKTFVLWAWELMGIGWSGDDGPLPPRPAVLRAARARLLKDGLATFLAKDDAERSALPPRRLTADELDALARDQDEAIRNAWHGDVERGHDAALASAARFESSAQG